MSTVLMRTPLNEASDERDSRIEHSSARAGDARIHALIVEHARMLVRRRGGAAVGPADRR
jgi:hypothetical protein